MNVTLDSRLVDLVADGVVDSLDAGGGPVTNAALERALRRVGVERARIADLEAELAYPVVVTYRSFDAWLTAEGG